MAPSKIECKRLSSAHASALSVVPGSVSSW